MGEKGERGVGWREGGGEKGGGGNFRAGGWIFSDDHRKPWDQPDQYLSR